MTKEGYVEVEGGRVWYKITGEESSAIPLIVLHGGPGSSHLSMEPLGALQNERPVVFYDQLGCGNSDRPHNPSLWDIEHFVRELAQVRQSLGLERVHILGHSWGTMLLADYLFTRPAGVASAIFSSPCLSAKRWIQDATRFRSELPADIQAALTEGEIHGTTDSEAYRQAEQVYLSRHGCRVEISQEQRERRNAAFGVDVYNAMWGPSEFIATGNLKEYDATGNLPDLTVPSLFTCGHFDEASPESTAYYHSLVPGSEFHVFDKSSHTPQLEQPADYLRVLRDFLTRADA